MTPVRCRRPTAVKLRSAGQGLKAEQFGEGTRVGLTAPARGDDLARRRLRRFYDLELIGRGADLIGQQRVDLGS